MMVKSRDEFDFFAPPPCTLGGTCVHTFTPPPHHCHQLVQPCKAELLIISLVGLSFPQYDYLAFYYKFILIVIYVIMLIVETVRLYLGNTGNLHEKVTELCNLPMRHNFLHFQKSTNLFLGHEVEMWTGSQKIFGHLISGGHFAKYWGAKFSTCMPLFQNTNSSFENTNSSFQNTNSSFQNTNSSFQNTNSSFQNTNSSFQNTNSSFQINMAFPQNSLF